MSWRLTSSILALFSARSVYRLSQKRASATRLSIVLVLVKECLFAENPGVFASSALGRVHDKRAFSKRNTRQAARDDRNFLTEKDVGSQVDVPSLKMIGTKRRGPRQLNHGLSDIVTRISLNSLAESFALLA